MEFVNLEMIAYIMHIEPRFWCILENQTNSRAYAEYVEWMASLGDLEELDVDEFRNQILCTGKQRMTATRTSSNKQKSDVIPKHIGTK